VRVVPVPAWMLKLVKKRTDLRKTPHNIYSAYAKLKSERPLFLSLNLVFIRKMCFWHNQSKTR